MSAVTPALAGEFFTLSHQGSPCVCVCVSVCVYTCVYPHCEKGGQSKYHRIKSREASVSLLWKERVRGSFIPEGVYRILPVFQELG